MITDVIIKALIDAGAGAVLAILILVGLYRLANKFLDKFIAVQQSQALAINELTGAIKESTEKDKTEHREIIIMLKYISERVDNISEKRREEDAG